MALFKEKGGEGMGKGGGEEGSEEREKEEKGNEKESSPKLQTVYRRNYVTTQRTTTAYIFFKINSLDFPAGKKFKERRTSNLTFLPAYF